MMNDRMRDLNTIAQWQSAEERNAIARAAIAQIPTPGQCNDALDADQMDIEMGHKLNDYNEHPRRFAARRAGS
jgi:hypothetical protein